jgi:hypothetical protein
MLFLAASAMQADFIYSTNNGAITITGYTDPVGAVTIPSTINSLTVTAIGTQAFYGASNMTSVSIPDTVTDIGENAFSLCTGLSSLTIPGSVATIEEDAFLQCSSLASVSLTNGLASIGVGAFAECTSLAGIAVPASVTNIGLEAFLDCGSLAAIVVDPQNAFYSSASGVLFDKPPATLLAAPGALTGKCAIPGGVTSVETYAFFNCSRITSVTVPASVTNIADYAFYFCTGVSNIFFAGAPPALGTNVFLSDNATVFYMPGVAGWSSPFGGLPSVLWNPLIKGSGAAFGLKNNQFEFVITGTTSIPIVVETSTNLAASVWTPVQTLTLSNGLFHFSQPAQANSLGQYFRISSP